MVNEGYTIDEFINMKLTEQTQRWANDKDDDFHSCRHCVNYKNHCKKLGRKLEVRKTSWSCTDETNCHTWVKIKSVLC